MCCHNFSYVVTILELFRRCTPCRAPCGLAEIEVKSCNVTSDRRCLPNPSCYQDCPPGKFESRPCSPPNVVQVCTVCSTCPAGYYIKAACTPKQDTVCAPCTPSICTSDAYNAQFGPPNGCTGTEYHDTAQCGVTTESFGQPCSPNFYRIQSRIFLPASLPSMSSGSSMVFDVSPDRSVYAYASGSTLSIYAYEGSSSKVPVASATLPDSSLAISDIRFDSTSTSIFATVRQSDAIYRCDVQCPLGNYILDWRQARVCSSPNNFASTWLSFPAPFVTCSAWIVASSFPESGRSMQGGCHIFMEGYDRMVCALGTYRAPLSNQPASRIYSVVTRDFAQRQPIDTFTYTSGTTYEILGPPAYSRATLQLFVFVGVHPSPTNNPFVIYRYQLQEETSVVLGQNVFYAYVQPGAGLVKSVILSASIRMDTNKLVAMDDTYKRIYVFSLQASTHSFSGVAGSFC